jgi:hypothetical protein
MASMTITADIWRLHRYEQIFLMLFQRKSILKWATRLHGAIYQNSKKNFGVPCSYFKYFIHPLDALSFPRNRKDYSESMFYETAS